MFQGVRTETGPSKGGRGALVVLEGLDRSGKSSQCARLLSFLKGKGYNAEGWRFPDRDTSVGQMISAYLANESQLDDRTIHLLFSANRWEKSARALMESKLLSGTTLIVDRYSYSGVAFSAAKGLDMEWCKAPENGLISPDLVIYLDVQPEKAAERGGYGGERYEKIEFQKKVAEHYHSLRDSTWKVVDGSLPMMAVEEKLRELATRCIQECQGNPLTNLASWNEAITQKYRGRDGGWNWTSGSTRLCNLFYQCPLRVRLDKFQSFSPRSLFVYQCPGFV